MDDLPPLPEWQHLKQCGYAPGNYMNRCVACRQVVCDLDRRATTCRACAEHAYARAAIAAQPPAQPDEKPEAWLDCGGDPHRRREDAMQDEESDPTPLYRRAQPPQAKDAQRWISVKDQLPEKFVEVLVAFDGLSIASTGQYTASPLDVGGWCYPHENRGACDDGTDPVVTHWMPLPEVPTIDAAKGSA